MVVAVRVGIAAIAALAAFGSAAEAQEFPASASFAQLTGEHGCVVQTGVERDAGDATCARARAMIDPAGLAVAPDQRFVYVTTGGSEREGSNAVAVFSRDQADGALAFSTCVSETGGDGRVGTDGFCGDGDALLGASDLAFSPDGRFLYVSAAGSNGVTWFARDPETGALKPAGCVKAVPRQDRCSGAPALIGADSVAVSPDGEQVYVTAALSGAVTVFARNGVSGALVEVMCISDTGSDGHCVDGTGLQGASSVVVAPDGRDVYVTAAEVGAVTSYRRNSASGRLVQAGCLLDRAPPRGSCRSARALAGARDAVLTPDGRQLLVASEDDSALAVFARDATSGDLTADLCFRNEAPRGDDQLNGGDGEADEADTDGCRPAKAISHVTRVAVSPDGRGVFASSPGDYLAAFERNPATGTIRQFGCAEEERTYRSCTQARNMTSARALAVSGDARSLYVATEDGVSVFGASTAIATRVAAVPPRRLDPGQARVPRGAVAYVQRPPPGRAAPRRQPRAPLPGARGAHRSRDAAPVRAGSAGDAATLARARDGARAGRTPPDAARSPSPRAAATMTDALSPPPTRT